MEWKSNFLYAFLSFVSGTLGETLVRHRSKPRLYIGCMKSGPVLSQRWDTFSSSFPIYGQCWAKTRSTIIQGSEIPWAWILEIRWSWKQVFPTCDGPTICHLKRFGYLHFNKPVSFNTSCIWELRDGLSLSHYIFPPMFVYDILSQASFTQVC